MSWLRNRLRSWLGVPSAADIRSMALREIDADAVWQSAEKGLLTTDRLRLIREREIAILRNEREDTRCD
jgi:hypothetical protein